MTDFEEEEERFRVLLIGNGGREHAIAWKLAQSPLVEAIFVAPGTINHSIRPALNWIGNGGTVSLEKTKNVDIGVSEFSKLVQFAQENNVNLVVPGPEVPLVEGIETWFRKGIYCGNILLTISWNTVFRAHSKGRKIRRIKGVLERFHDTA